MFNEIFYKAESSPFIFTVRTQREHATAIIGKAQNTIAFTENQGIKTDMAEIKLEEAKKPIGMVIIVKLYSLLIWQKI